MSRRVKGTRSPTRAHDFKRYGSTSREAWVALGPRNERLTVAVDHSEAGWLCGGGRVLSHNGLMQEEYPTQRQQHRSDSSTGNKFPSGDTYRIRHGALPFSFGCFRALAHAPGSPRKHDNRFPIIAAQMRHGVHEEAIQVL